MENQSQPEENLVKKTCRELGITQKELAEKTGIAEQTIRNWSAGQKIPIWAYNYFNILNEFYNYKLTIDLFQQFNQKLSTLKYTS
jgi:transcriptional regulator with XRE-family HTH domain